MTNIDFKSGYSDVNGLKMYYEIYGQGKPLVLIHGGGSTIQTSFAGIIPFLAKNRQLIAAEMQAHGRTSDRSTGSSFKQDADDIATLLKNLGIAKADVLGFSNGGQTTIELALRHPQLLNKIILCSIFYKKSGTFPGFWKGFESEVQFSSLPQPYKDEFLRVNNDPAALLNMFNRDVQRMKEFTGWTDEQMHSISVPTLVVNGNEDVGSPEHAVEMYRIIPGCKLAILPGTHGTYLGELTTAINNSRQPELAAVLFDEFLG